MARSAGIDLRNGSGTVLQGRVVLRSGLRLGSGSVAATALELLRQLDDASDRSGRLDGSDAAFKALGLVTDQDADSVVDTAEFTTFAQAGVKSLSVAGGATITDGFGNVRTPTSGQTSTTFAAEATVLARSS